MTGRYVSDTPVSVRVDKAWGRGYEAGHKDGVRHGKQLAFAAIAVTTLALVKRRPSSIPWVIILAGFVVPCLVVFLAVRSLVNRERAIRSLTGSRSGRQGMGESVTPDKVTLSDGSTF
jgi:hypothetical protein